MSAYPLAHFVGDLEFVLTAAGSERDVLEAVGPLAQKFAAEMTRPEADAFTWHDKYGMGDLELYQAPDDGLFIALGAWQPGHGVPPHDHGTWTVVVGLEGEEHNTLWRRRDDGSRPGFAEIDKLDTTRLGPGQVIAMTTEDIHSVDNSGNAVSYTLHVYGQNLAATGRRQYDPEAQTVAFVAYDLA
jgi:predicted metal-dependent enzyme (double-stranded beta helix superfamily)